MTAERRIRNAGKPRRASRTTPPKHHRPASTLDDGQTLPSWHELVQPGPAGNPTRTHQRRDDRGQVTTLNRTAVPPPDPPARQGGPVRVGLAGLRRRATGAPVPGAREAMLAIRERPRDRRRAARREAARSAVQP